MIDEDGYDNYQRLCVINGLAELARSEWAEVYEFGDLLVAAIELISRDSGATDLITVGHDSPSDDDEARATKRLTSYEVH